MKPLNPLGVLFTVTEGERMDFGWMDWLESDLTTDMLAMNPERSRLDPAVPFIAVEAARAWQAFRDFLNGSVEQWKHRALSEYFRGAAIVYEEFIAEER